MVCNLEKWAQYKCMTFCFVSNPLNYKNRQERKLLLWYITKKFNILKKILKFVDIGLKECESQF